MRSLAKMSARDRCIVNARDRALAGLVMRIDSL